MSASALPAFTGVRRTEPTSSVPTSAVNDRSRQMRRALAQPEGGAREAAGSEGALVQPLDRIGVARALGANDEGKRGHGGPCGRRAEDGG